LTPLSSNSSPKAPTFVEWILLCMSLPLACVAYAIGHLAAAFLAGDTLLHRMSRQGLGLIVGTLLLMVGSALMAGPVAQWQDDQNRLIRDPLQDRFEAALACQDDPAVEPARRKECEGLAMEMADLVSLVDTQFFHTYFRPPEAWVFLWHQPFRRPARWAWCISREHPYCRKRPATIKS
jgi:hypothetical protein